MRLAGTLFRPGTDAPPGLLIVAGPGESREAWSPAAAALQRSGYLVLTVDPRGQGESMRSSAGTIDARSFSDTAWREGVRDFAAGHEMLLRSGADPENIGVMTSGGATALALAYASAIAGAQVLVLVSPELEVRGTNAGDLLAALPPRPILLLYSTNDTYSASSARRLKELAEGFTELREYQGGFHGGDLLSASSNARQQVTHWLETVLSGAS